MYTNYQRGKHFEKRIMKFYEGLGYLVINRPRSKFPDLICLKSGSSGENIVMFIECKTNNWLSKDEMLGFKKLRVDFPLAELKVCWRKNRKIMVRDVFT